MQVSPSVQFIPNPTTGPAGSHGSNVFVIGSGDAALIDSGYGTDHAVDAKLSFLREQAGLRVRRILITHSHLDHVGGAPRLKEALGADIAMHEDEPLPRREDSEQATGEAFVPDYKRLHDGQVLEVDDIHILTIHTPGHSPGHLCYFLPEEGVLFTGDHVAGAGTIAIHPRFGSMAAYMASLEKVLKYDAEILCPGHGPVVSEPKRKIEELLEHRREREQQILRGFRSGKTTVEQLLWGIYPDLDGRLLQAAANQIIAHIVKLQDEGKVIRTGEDAEGDHWAIA